jgi:phosphoribosyl 1,2-cyclic phosphodiesterase
LVRAREVVLAQPAEMSVRFWGVRGSIPCPGDRYARYGGNTSCLELRCGPHLLILDGGTGLRPLGESLGGNGPIDADLFLTHTHIDHISGLPFFLPAYKASNKVRLWAGHLTAPKSLRDVLCGMMQEPLFPVPVDVLKGCNINADFKSGATIEPKPGVVIRTAPLNHPNGATGYRIDYGGKSICYITDTEHRDGVLDANILGLIQGADIFIYDSTYTPEEYPRHRGWGHSTWEEGVKLANAAQVKTYVVFHHDPGHDDVFMDRVAAEVAQARPGTLVAKEGMLLTP